MTPEEVARRQQQGAVVVDTRPSAEYAAGHVPGSYHIGQSGQLASWAGALLSPEKPIVVVAEDEERVAESRTRLTRVGLENVTGYLAGGIRAWDESGRPLARTEQIDVAELRDRLAEDRALQLIDVRRPPEWEAGHIARAAHMPLHRLGDLAGSLDRERPVAVICRSGYRSSIATSVLERMGFRKPTNVVGGMDAWTGAQFDTQTGEEGRVG
jgi:hydroxyacylglutathione hydrolase